MTRLRLLAIVLLVLGASVGIWSNRFHAKAVTPATVTYNYDSLGRIVMDGYSGTTTPNTLNYTYDNAGNRTQTSTTSP